MCTEYKYIANFSVIGDTNNGLLPSFSDSVLESVGTPSENININSSDHMHEADLNSEYLPPVDSPTDSDEEPVHFRVGRARTRGAVARGRGLRTRGRSSVRGRPRKSHVRGGMSTQQEQEIQARNPLAWKWEKIDTPNQVINLEDLSFTGEEGLCKNERKCYTIRLY